MIETQELKPEIISNDPLIGELGKTIDRTPARLITKDITQNGTYNASDDNVDGYSKVNVNIPLGLEYETGTYTPTEETTRPTISFSKIHTDTPAFVMIIDGSSERTTNGGLGFWHYIDYEKWFSATIPMSANPSTPPAYVATYLFYMPSSSYTEKSNELRYSSSDTTDTNTNYPRYYVTPTNFKPGVVTTTQAKFIANRTYKWVAIWK